MKAHLTRRPLSLSSPFGSGPRWWLGALTSALTVMFSPIASGQSSYAATELKPFFLGSAASGLGLSPKGDVVGHANVLQGYKFVFGDGIVGDYESSGVIWPMSTAKTQAPTRVSRDFTPLGMNAAGVMVTTSGLYQSGKSLPLEGNLWGYFPRAYAINAQGDVAGTFSIGGGHSLPAMWVNRSLVRLPKPAGAQWATAADLNDNGQVAGATCDEQTQIVRAVRWTAGQIEWVGAEHSQGIGLNNLGQMLIAIGTPTGNGSASESAAVVQPDGSLLPVLAPNGGQVRAIDINNHGDVLGRSSTGPFIRKADGTFIDLIQLAAQGKIQLPSGMALRSCSRLNDQGALICSGFIGSKSATVRLRPL